MTLPTCSVAQGQALAKARWLLATYLADYTDAAIAGLGSWVGAPPVVWFVGSDLDTVGDRALDVLPALFVVPLNSTVTDSPTADGTPFGSANSDAVWSVRCVVDNDKSGTDTAPVIAGVWAMAAAQCLTERLPEPGGSNATWIWNAHILSDATSPVYIGESQHRASVEVQISVQLRYQSRVIKTVWPGVGLVPSSVNETINAPAAVVTGDATGSIQPGGSLSIAASAYVAGLQIAVTGCASLSLVNQDTYQTHALLAGGTVAPVDLPANTGDVWTITGVTGTNALRSYRITWT
jgi:hypothetical protein